MEKHLDPEKIREFEEGLELYGNTISWLKCEDDVHHFIISYENKYYIVLFIEVFDIVLDVCFDTLQEAENHYYKYYEYFNE